MIGYIKFIEQIKTSRKTKVWHVQSKHDGSILGCVKWHSPWRRYVYQAHGDTLYDKACLTVIAAFCDAKTLEQKEKWKINKAKTN
tara:strand:- start:335 stop:589 length:255 start_codon:yes stop_codon:yes gene_type:complete